MDTIAGIGKGKQISVGEFIFEMLEFRQSAELIPVFIQGDDIVPELEQVARLTVEKTAQLINRADADFVKVALEKTIGDGRREIQGFLQLVSCRNSALAASFSNSYFYRHTQSGNKFQKPRRKIRISPGASCLLLEKVRINAEFQRNFRRVVKNQSEIFDLRAFS